jgi:U3 small nucleolar ribonucleoprotein protein LCP5
LLRNKANKKRKIIMVDDHSADLDEAVTHSSSAPLQELARKVEGSLQEKIQQHVHEYTVPQQQGLDFLHTKNSVMLSYLIELAFQLQCRRRRRGRQTSTTSAASASASASAAEIAALSNDRLLELRTILEKMRGLDKKLRYQIDKLLALNKTDEEQNLATAVADDPLMYRPGDVDDDDDDDSSVEQQQTEEQANGDDGSDNDDSAKNDDDDDDDLAAARQTVALAKTQQIQQAASSSFNKRGGGDDGTTTGAGGPADAGLYRAPRHAAVPYTHDTASKEDRERAKDLRRHRQLRDSEVAEAIRHDYSDLPETEDARGGTALGQQRAASRSFLAQQREKERFEEEHYMRLTVTKVEKKNRNRLMRDEMSNLAAIADLGNITKESKLERKIKQQRQEQSRSRRAISSSSRTGGDAAPLDGDNQKRPYEARPRNGLQADIFGGEQAKKKKKFNKR